MACSGTCSWVAVERGVAWGWQWREEWHGGGSGESSGGVGARRRQKEGRRDDPTLDRQRCRANERERGHSRLIKIEGRREGTTNVDAESNG